MKCSDAQPLLDLLNDGALDTKDSALVLDHINKCECCQAVHASNELLRSKFIEARTTTTVPPDLMDRISNKLKEDERKSRTAPLSSSMQMFIAVAACMALLAIPLVQGGFHSHITKFSDTSADSLVNEVASLENVKISPNSEIARQVGYDIKRVNLPDWQLERSGVMRNTPFDKIARFEFASRNKSGGKLTCYQALKGTIVAGNAERKTIGDKQVKIGRHGNLSYGVWSQNDRDYLFVSDLPLEELEEVISKA